MNLFVYALQSLRTPNNQPEKAQPQSLVKLVGNLEHSAEPGFEVCSSLLDLRNRDSTYLQPIPHIVAIYISRETLYSMRKIRAHVAKARWVEP